jgi:MFS family permease
MNGRNFLYKSAVVASLAGFLFGFDTVVISGAEQTIQSLWDLNSSLHGLAISMALWGTVLGSVVRGWPAEYFGRKKTLLWIGILYLASAVDPVKPQLTSSQASRPGRTNLGKVLRNVINRRVNL